ncbi:MAG: MFS transporter [Dehalococcoidia bacterium]|nr:MAG: MFS transporter [Dehalococcoidia bacterium]
MTRFLPPGLLDNFVVFGNRDLRFYLSGQMIVQTGLFMQSAAQAWLIWELTRSTAALGLIGVLNFVPTLLLGPVAGAVGDKVERRNLLLLTQSAAMLLAVTLTVLIATGAVQAWHIFVLAGALGILQAFEKPAGQALIGDLAGIDRVRQAVSVNMASFQVGRMIGPAFAGWLIGATGAATAFGLNAVSFLAFIGALLAIRPPRRESHLGQQAAGGFTDAIAYIRRKPAIQNLLIFNLLVSLFGMSVMQVMPAITTDLLGGDAQLLGLLMGASGAGALVGSLFFAPVVQRVHRINLAQAIGVFLVGLIIVGVGASRLPVLTGLFLLGEGSTIAVILAISSGLMQISAPPQMRARLIAISMMITMGAQPLAALLLGTTAQLFGAGPAVLANGVTLLTLATLLLLFRRSIRQTVDTFRPTVVPDPEATERPALVLAER